MKGWKIGGIVSFSIITLIYGIIIYVLSTKPDAVAKPIFTVLKTYPILILIFVPIGVIIGLIVSALKFLFGKPEKSKKKKGQIWVSTVLYIALGIIAMTLILGAGLPMIKRMKDRNTFVESKTMMYTIQDHISTVVGEGPGSRRVLDPVIIKGGKLIFETADDKIRWEMKTGTMLMEPCEPDDNGVCSEGVQSEGGLKFYLAKTFVEKEYIVNILLDYEGKVNLEYDADNEITGSLTGNYMIALINAATTEDPLKIEILIS